MRTQLTQLSLTLAAIASLTACSHSDVKPDATSAKAPAAVQAPPPAPAVDQAAAAYKAQGQDELDKALAALRNVSVFFEFDSATLTKDASDKLAQVADVLSRHPELDVKIEGNCDERGSAQYNLALGQKRADVVKKYLDQLGVKSTQIRAISLGSEKPIDPGHDEEAWKKNRRADVQPSGTPVAAPVAPAQATPDATPASATLPK